MPETIKLRGHHFLCVLTYLGKGYTEKFVENMGAVVSRINEGAEIEIVRGSDDICAALRHGAEITCSHGRVCRGAQVQVMDRAALKDVARVLQIRHLGTGDKITLGKGEIAHLRQHFLHKSIRRACTGCSWHELCSGIAANKFAGTKLMPKATL